MKELLAQAASPWDRRAYLAFLSTKTMGRDPFFLDAIPSTNDWIAARLAEPGIERAVAIAERQTAGRGRRGRIWISPEGVSLAFSLAWEAPQNMVQPGVITLAVAVALAEAVETICRSAPTLKYPNDLMFGEKKAAGILTEMKSGPGKRYAVIGVGVNVNTQKAMFPADIALIATSLLAETGKIIAREHVLAGFINRLEPMLDLLARGGLKDIMYRYRRLAAPLMGMEARVTGAGADLCGVAEGIADDGALMVRMAGGDMARAYGGEVTFRK